MISSARPKANSPSPRPCIYLATAPKSNAAYVAFGAAMRAAKEAGSLLPPKHILNAPTKLMKTEGYGRATNTTTTRAEAFSGQDYFPEQLGRQQFYDPPERGFEREIASGWNIGRSCGANGAGLRGSADHASLAAAAEAGPRHQHIRHPEVRARSSGCRRLRCASEIGQTRSGR